MKIRASLSVFAALGLALGSSQAATIFTESFETTDTSSDPDGTTNIVPIGWGDLNTLLRLNTNTASDVNTPYGTQVAWTNSTTGGTSNAGLIGNLAAGTYTLTFNASARAGTASYLVELIAGGVVLGNVTASGLSNTNMVDHASTPLVFDAVGHAQLGNDIQIRLAVGGDGDFQPQFDNIVLDFVPVPEPSAALLGAFGGLLLLRRRR